MSNKSNNDFLRTISFFQEEQDLLSVYSDMKKTSCREGSNILRNKGCRSHSGDLGLLQIHNVVFFFHTEIIIECKVKCILAHPELLQTTIELSQNEVNKTKIRLRMQQSRTTGAKQALLSKRKGLKLGSCCTSVQTIIKSTVFNTKIVHKSGIQINKDFLQ